MSELEQYFIFVNTTRRVVSEESKGGKVVITIESLIKKVLMKWLNVLGENCVRVPVDFDPLKVNEAFLVVCHADTSHKREPYIYKNEISFISAFDTLAEAEQYYSYIINGGYNEKISKEETFVEAKIHCMPIDKH